MSDYVSISRNEEGLTVALRELETLKTLQKEVKVENGHSLMRLLELRDLLLLSEAIALSAIERKESRFGLSHYRSDYPETREEWHNSTHVTLKDGNLKIKYVRAYK